MSPSKPPEGWRPPAELDRPVPRPIRLTRAGILLYVLSALLLAGGFLVAAWLSGVVRAERAEAHRLAVEGRWADAAVTRLSRSGEDEGDYLVDYRFAANGRDHSGQVSVDGGRWKRLHVLSALLVRYLPSDPAHHYVTEFPPGVTPGWLPLLAGGAIAGAGVLLPLQVRRQRRLLRDGSPALATVTRVRPRRQRNIVHYRFDLPGGGCCEGRSTMGGKAMSNDDAICVLYDPHHPRRNAVYPLSEVRVAESA